MLEFALESLRQVRQNFLHLADELDATTLNAIPSGFRNHIAWHLGHLIAVQQHLCCVRAGRAPQAPDWVMKRFARGTVPRGPVTPVEMRVLRELLFVHVDQLAQDYADGRLTTFQAYDSSLGVRMASIEDAICFLPVHEGTHLGYAMAMRRQLNN
ncbi:MAG: DinB family protein [Bacteroidota bacterium]